VQRELAVVAQSLRKPALVVFLVACSATQKPSTPPAPAKLSFIEDDYPRALADARAKKKPIFVDAWAPWCHSCLSMKNYVLGDPSLATLANDFVWLSIDTERESNAPFVAKFTHEALPTLWVIAPEDEHVALQWAGTLTARELRTMLSDLAAPATPERASHARIEQLSKTDQAACARMAVSEAKKLPRGTPRADIVAEGIDCARDAKLEAELAELLAVAQRDASEGGDALLADDRSALYESIVDTKKERGDVAGARAAAAEWARLLEGEAAKAKTKEARAVFDAHRAEAYIALGEPQRAVAMLQESEKDFPSDYNPPARLAWVYLEMKKLDDATLAVERAKKLVYGPRVLRVLVVAADIAKAKGDREGERRALDEALARTENKPLTRGQTKLREGLILRRNALP